MVVANTCLERDMRLNVANVGRPTKYNDGLLKQTIDYLDNYEDYGDIIPSIEGLADVLDISTVTIYDWQKQESKKAFSNTLDRIHSRQKKVLIHKGLDNTFNSNIVKLALGNHGMSEKTQTEISGVGGKPLHVIGTEMSAEEATLMYKDIIDA